MANRISSLIIFLALVFSACKEEPPYISFEPDRTISDTTYILQVPPAPQQKCVLIEEVTGVRCPNCPAAQLEAKTIYNNNPGRVNILTIHPLNRVTGLTRPFDPSQGDAYTSKYDFRTDAGAQIYDLMGTGETGALPIGNVNRKLFPAQVHRNVLYGKWSGFVNAELALSTPVNIVVNGRNTGDSVEVELTITYTQAVSDSQYITVSILESEMEDVQESKDLNGNTIYVEDYIHHHVLRAVVTKYLGDYLHASYVPGRVFYKKYRIKRETKWDKTNLDVLAMVHLSTTKKDVIHSKEAKVN